MENKFTMILSKRSLCWKSIFNTALKQIWWGTIENANRAAKEAGYSYFTWNEWIYEVDGKQIIQSIELDESEKLKLSEKDLESLYQYPPEEIESEWQMVHRMGRNGMVLELLSKIKVPDYDSN